MVTMGTYLMSDLQFSGKQVGLIYSTQAVGAVVSPIIVGMIADRYFPTQRVMGVCHILGAVLILAAALSKSFFLVYLFMMGYFMATLPTVALSSTLTFRHIEDLNRDFPRIRVWGTIGWIAAGLLVGFLMVEDQNIPLLFASAFGFVLGFYSFSLPHTPPEIKSEKVTLRELLGFDALMLFKETSFAVLIILAAILNIPRSFYLSFTNPFLNEEGMINAAGKMSAGQVFEIVFMLLLPWFLKKYGIKKVLLLALIGWVIRYLAFAFGEVGSTVWIIYIGILLHGLCYVFFFVSTQIYVEQQAPAGVKSAAQGIITFFTAGIGSFIGSIVAGTVVDANVVSEGIHDWTQIWLVPAAMAFFVLFALAALFHPKKE